MSRLGMPAQAIAPRGGATLPRSRVYVMVYGVHRTTIYLPDDLKRALARLAAARSCTEAELVREAVASLLAASEPPPPRLPLFDSGQPELAENIDEALGGFGEK